MSRKSIFFQSLYQKEIKLTKLLWQQLQTDMNNIITEGASNKQVHLSSDYASQVKEVVKHWLSNEPYLAYYYFTPENYDDLLATIVIYQNMLFLLY